MHRTASLCSPFTLSVEVYGFPDVLPSLFAEGAATKPPDSDFEVHLQYLSVSVPVQSFLVQQGYHESQGSSSGTRLTTKVVFTTFSLGFVGPTLVGIWEL